MRLQLVILLTLAAVFSGNASATTMTRARSIMVNQDDAPAKRLLRSDATARIDDDDEERAAWYESLTKVFKPKMLTKLERENPELAKLARKYDLTGAFKSLELAKFQTVDDLFTSKKYELWLSYMIHWNSQSKNEPYSVAKFFSKQFGASNAFEIFTVAAKSTNTNVKQMGKAFQVQLFKEFRKAGDDAQTISKTLGGDQAAAKMFATVIQSTSKSDRNLGRQFRDQLLKQWVVEGKTHKEVVKIAPSFGNAYTRIITDLARASEKSAVAKAKAAAGAAGVATAGRAAAAARV